MSPWSLGRAETLFRAARGNSSRAAISGMCMPETGLSRKAVELIYVSIVGIRITRICKTRDVITSSFSLFFFLRFVIFSRFTSGEIAISRFNT